VKFGSRAHLLDHVQVVVAGAAVGSEAYGNPGFEHSGTGATPLASFMLLAGLWETLQP